MSRTDTAKQSFILFNDERPDSLFLKDLYDPDLHGSNIDESGKIRGQAGSLVIDGDSASDTYRALYYIEYVDPTTKKSYLKTPRIVVGTDTEDDATYIINYGNDKFLCYYDDRINPTKLAIDAKLIIFGATNVEYRLSKYNKDSGTKEIISIYLDSDEVIKGNRIPLTSVGGALPNAKYCTNCHTLSYVEDGDVVTIEIFNNNGILSAEFDLLVKRAIILNDLASEANPIVNFDADCLQMRGDEWYLYEKQDPSALNIRPYIEYYDGAKQYIVVDNIQCFLYGLEDFIPSFPGHKQKLLIKYFLNHREITTLKAADPRYPSVCVEKYLTVIDNNSEYGMKVSVVPVWNILDQLWNLKFFAYTERRDEIYDITSQVKVDETFDGALFNVQQEVIFEFDTSVIFGLSNVAVYQQSIWLTLKMYKNFDRYIIKDTKNDEFAYGVETSVLRRPVLHYDTTLKQYFVPTSVFKNANAFIEAFYTIARPPFNPLVETKPLVPTHFTVRGHDNSTVVVANPIEISQYNQAWNIVRNGQPDQLVGGNVIVEFLQLVGDQYKILYGVPVDVHTSKTGYNTDKNNIK